jgi:hypothetical protein
MLKYLGKGASACAVTPPLSCLAGSGVDTRSPTDSYISKIFYSNDTEAVNTKAQHEYESGTKLRELDADNAFTVEIGGWCMPNKEELRESNIHTVCELELDDVLRDQIFYKYGGITFNEFAKTNLAGALQSLSSILRGLVIMGHAFPPLIHGDIHGKNILVGSDGVSRLIDYGEVCTPATLWKRPELLKYDFFCFPPERYIAVKEFTGRFPDDIDTSPRMEILEDLGVSGDELMFQFDGMCKMFYEETSPFVKDILKEKDRQFFVLDVLAQTFGKTYDLFGLAMTVASACVYNQTQWKSLPSRIRRAVRVWVSDAARYNAYSRLRPREALERWLEIWDL